MPSASCCRHLSIALGPLETTGTFAASSSSSCSSSSPLPPPSPPRGRRLRRVLYPASQRRRPPMREAPDQARRWLLILSALVFLQIYTEETHTCTELQGQCPDLAGPQLQEGEGNLGTTQAWAADESWRVQIVAGASEAQLECVVS